MSWAERYLPKRTTFWPEVEDFFSNLPPILLQQSMLLKNNLATFYADTGQFKDILTREHDHPLLYLHFWLLDDLAIPDAAAREMLERHLFLAMAFTFAAVYTQETILDESTNFDHTFMVLAQALTRQADVHLAQLFPGRSPFWAYYRRFWDESAEAALLTADRRSFGQSFGTKPQTVGTTAKKLAFSKIPVAAVLIGTDHEATLPQLCSLMDRLNFVLQTRRDITTLKRDLTQRNFTYPIARTMHGAGIDPHQSVAPERVLGALVLTGTMEKICDECLSSLDECHAMATALNLPTFTAYFEVVAALLGEVRGLFDMSKTPRRAASQPRPISTPHTDTLPKAIEMAEAYLLADPTLRDSWEIQRRGTFGLPEMTAKAFPSGLIIEILGRHGHDMADPVDGIFTTLEANGFRYFDFPGIPPDADDLGLLLRLFSLSTRQQAHRQILQTPLGWLRQNMAESGEIPVWFTCLDGNEFTQPGVSLWGQSCITVEANLLLGLIDYDLSAYRDLIEKSARSILARWIAYGLSATRHYVPLYSLWIGSELMAKLSATPLAPLLRDQLAQTTQTMAERLATEAGRAVITPQDAALLTLACLSNGCPPPAKSGIKHRWITRLCQTQRYDGSWAGEPLYGTPTRGELASWYSSRSVTTAFCYQALRTYHANREKL